MEWQLTLKAWKMCNQSEIWLQTTSCKKAENCCCWLSQRFSATLQSLWHAVTRSLSAHTHTHAESCAELEVIAVIFQLNTLVEKRWSCCCRKLELEKPVGSNRETSLPHPFPCDVTDKSGEETEQKRRAKKHCGAIECLAHACKVQSNIMFLWKQIHHGVECSL